MDKYIKYYQMGFIEGLKDSINGRNKKFKKLNDKEFKSKLYDIGYIDAYKFVNKNMSFKNNKNIV